MTDNCYTPGPWIAHHSEHPITKAASSFVNNADGRPIADGIHGPSPAARKANASLIAASPFLLDTLRFASHALRSYQYGNSSADLAQDVADAADAAIAKATS